MASVFSFEDGHTNAQAWPCASRATIAVIASLRRAEGSITVDKGAPGSTEEQAEPGERESAQGAGEVSSRLSIYD